MGEVVPARTSPTLHPSSAPTVHQYVVTSTLRVNVTLLRSVLWNVEIFLTPFSLMHTPQ